MAGLPRSYRSIEEFEREEIRPGFRIGFSLDDLEEGTFEGDSGVDLEREGDLFDQPDGRSRSNRARSEQHDEQRRRRLVRRRLGGTPRPA